MSDKYAELDQVLEEEAWEYLYTNYPPLAAVVQKSVGKGIVPEEIRRRVVEKAGAHREALAQRCELAAKYLERNK
jgi:hypothetical protein